MKCALGDFVNAQKLILLVDFCAPPEGGPTPIFYARVSFQAAYFLSFATISF